jgi:hypothetical protein
MACGTNTHSIAAARHSFDLFATRFCIQTPVALCLQRFVANAAPTVARHTPARSDRP